MNSKSKSMVEFQERFGGIARLYGIREAKVLQETHFAVIGIGGVGSWAAEALARSGIGQITLIDMDEVCLTNTNRQVHAETTTVGVMKTSAMKRRIKAINPDCEVIEEKQFFTSNSSDDLLSNGYKCIVDAIDDCKNKCLLLSRCKKAKIPVVTTGGAGGKRDPAQVIVADITKSYNDPLMARVRKKLRQEYGFSRNPKRSWGIPCVFSPEEVVYSDSDGSVCKAKPENVELQLDCNSGYGTASFLTGTIGFHATAKAIELVLRRAAY